MHTRWTSFLAALLVSGGVAITSASCLVTFPDEHGEGGKRAGETCNVDGDCDDQEPCTVDECVESFCEHTPVDDGPLATGQKAGDCQRIVCTSGESGSEPDNTDIPDDDKDCTQDSCNLGVASHVPRAAGTTCTNGLGNVGRCSAQGECEVPCTIATDCVVDPPNPCVVPSCDTVEAVCTFPSVTDGTPTPGFPQTAGDCKVHICLAGVDTEQVDPSDVNVTATDCDVELCIGGTPDNSPVALGSVCSTFMGTMPGHCDGLGACRECDTDADCGGRIDDCNFNACVNFACAIGHDPDGTLVGAALQPAGDCHTRRCDGAGNITDDIDDSDKPEDGNVCRDDLCTSGVPSHVPHPGIQCGGTAANPILCNAQGQCGCMTNMDCTSPNTCGGGNPGTPLICGCTKKTCAQVGATCGLVADGCFGTQNCNDSTENGNETDVDCGGGGACANKCAAGKECDVASDCLSGFCVDGVCCSTACTGACQACSSAKKGGGTNGTCGAIANNTDPDSECADDGAASCGNNGVCNGSGACRKYPAGTQCRAQNGDCDVAETCPGNGAACPGDGYAPNSTVCRSSTGVCDPAESCTGSSPTCPANVYSPPSAVCRNANGACDVAESCTGSSPSCPSDGFVAGGTQCRAKNGDCDVAESCTGSSPSCPSDGFAPSTTVCRVKSGVCDVAESCSGSGPSCPSDAFMSLGTADVPTCSGSHVCDGSGTGASHCKLKSGQSCTTNGECASNNCVGAPTGTCG